jgi:dipeptidyl aminopeptidase/acylaminoacyl peptidase
MPKTTPGLLAALLWLTACTPAAILPSEPPTIATVGPTFTQPPSPTFDPGTPSPAPTGTPTPFPHPMSIEALRGGSYPGSDIVVVDELARGANYSRFYVYYLSEGLKIYALLTLPDGELPSGGWPAIVFNHGYIPPDIYRTTERYIAYVDRLAASGFVVFLIDYRGNDQSEGEATGAYGNPGYTVDVLNAVASIQRHPQVNPERVGMWGHSMGGFLTLRAMVITSDVKAGVIWAGVVGSYNDLLYNWRRTGGFTPSPSSRGTGWRTQWLGDYGPPEENPDFWQAVSANTYLNDLSGPVQLHHGTSDEDVPVEFSQTLYEQVRLAGKYAELYTYPGDNHNISNYFTSAMDQTIQFFKSYLQ